MKSKNIFIFASSLLLISCSSYNESVSCLTQSEINMLRQSYMSEGNKNKQSSKKDNTNNSSFSQNVNNTVDISQYAPPKDYSALSSLTLPEDYITDIESKKKDFFVEYDKALSVNASREDEIIKEAEAKYDEVMKREYRTVDKNSNGEPTEAARKEREKEALVFVAKAKEEINNLNEKQVLPLKEKLSELLASISKFENETFKYSSMANSKDVSISLSQFDGENSKWSADISLNLFDTVKIPFKTDIYFEKLTGQKVPSRSNSALWEAYSNAIEDWDKCLKFKQGILIVDSKLKFYDLDCGKWAVYGKIILKRGDNGKVLDEIDVRQLVFQLKSNDTSTTRSLEESVSKYKSLSSVKGFGKYIGKK